MEIKDGRNDGGENSDGIYKPEDKGESWIRINDAQNCFGSLNGFITGDSNVYRATYTLQQTAVA